MESSIVVADDKGLCIDEVRGILEPTDISVVHAASMEDCIQALRKTKASLLVVSATMKRAFSLLRIIRHSRDMRSIPLIVIAAPGQEELIEKHGQLPSRADRYLLLPLDPKLFLGVVRDLQGSPKGASGAGDLEESEFDGMPTGKGAYQKIQNELRRSREKLLALEADLHAALQTSKQSAELREENEALRMRIQANDTQARSMTDYSSIFDRLESGYKDTIADLERLVREKDDLVKDLRAQLPSSDEIGVNARELMNRIERQNSRISSSRDRATRVLEILERMQGQLEGLDLESWMRTARDAADEVDMGFSDEESTQILDLSSIKNLVND